MHHSVPPLGPLIIILLAHFADLLSVSWGEGGAWIQLHIILFGAPTAAITAAYKSLLRKAKKIKCKLQMKLHALPLEKSADQKRWAKIKLLNNQQLKQKPRNT